MTARPDVDDRLRILGLGGPQPEPAELRARAAAIRARAHRRRTRRRLGGVGLAMVLAVGVGALGVIAERQQRDRVTTGPGSVAPAPLPSTTVAPKPSSTSTSIALGAVPGLAITVSPSTGLRDGDPVLVLIDGLDQLSDPQILQCAGDVTPESVTRRCDLRRLEVVGGPAGVVGPEQSVAIRRTISTSDGEATTRHDCATEPAGCVLAVGEAGPPVRGIAVPIRFDASVPLPSPTVSAEPASGLTAHERLTIRASGLSPNTTFRVQQCSIAAEPACDELTWPTARSDAEGRLTTEVPALPVLYGWRGRVDCTSVRCEVVVSDDTGVRFGAAAVAFSPSVDAPVPRLEIDPAGPYRDDQVVTVRGSGFPPGVDIGAQIGQCPDGRDTAVEERCGRPNLSTLLVADDGTFTMEVKLVGSLLYTGPCGTIGCHLGWVLPHGPTVAMAPLAFAP